MRRLLYQASRWLGGTILLPFARFRVEGAENLPKRGAVILACNHLSYFDPPFVSRALRREIDWMAMAELFRSPWLRPWLRATGVFPVDRSRVDRQAVKTALERLKMGRALGMFPEGGIRTAETSVLAGAELRPGVSALAQMSQAPVVPCVILGSLQFESREGWRFGRRKDVNLIVGPAFRCEGTSKEARTAFEAELGARLRALGNLVQHKTTPKA